jgi:hypothetical protein
MPYSKYRAMKTYEEVQDPQNTLLNLPYKYSTIPALYSGCSDFSYGPRGEVSWTRCAMILLSTPRQILR